MNSAGVPAHTSLQHMRDMEGRADLTNIVDAAIFHDARPADDLEVSNFRQLSQNVVLNSVSQHDIVTISKESLKWEHGNSGGGSRLEQLNLPADHANADNQCRQRKRGNCSGAVSAEALSTAMGETCTSCLD